MATLYAEEYKATLDSDVANGAVAEGDLIVREAGGTCRTVDPASDSAFDAIVLHTVQNERIAEHDEDYAPLDSFEYEDGERVMGVCPLVEKDVILPQTIPDNGTDPAPSFQKNTEVGVAKLSDESIGVVEAGYADDAGTQYGDGGAGDFIALGAVNHEDPNSDFAERVAVRVEN